METTLLATKLVVPPARPGLVPRTRLVERLAGALSSNLTLVSSPAGFGKTTLLSEWARSSRPQVRTAWLSLEESDNDPIRFWDYFIAALQTLQPGCGEKMLPWLHSSQPPSTEPMLTALINDLSSINGDRLVIMDDYHLIGSKQIHDGIIYLIEHLPAQVHLVIAARADPPMPLARFRGKGMMLEIGSDDLRFTPDEAANLLAELKTPGLSAKDIGALHERTEGWAVGIKMAALSMSGQKDITGFIAAFAGSQRYIMDYLLEEVLQKQQPEVRDFLVKTSILERLTGPLCDAVTERTGGHEMLPRLEKENLFLVPLDNSMEWYRYHHLFADLLRHQCRTVYGREQVATLHRQASQWYEDNGLPDQAIRHALGARDWEISMRLINASYEERRKKGEFDTVLGWLRAIPEGVLREHLHLYSRYAVLLAQRGQVDAADAALGYLESATHDSALDAQIALSRGFVCRGRGDNEQYLELSEKAFALSPPDDVATRSRAAANVAHVRHRVGPLQEAEEWATRASELGQQAGDIWIAMTALAFMGDIAGYQGKPKRAVEIYKTVLESAGRAGVASEPYGNLCIVQYLMNDLEGTAENARLAVQGRELNAIVGHYYQAQVCLARRDAAGAAEAMDKLDQAGLDPSLDLAWRAYYIACRVMYAIRQGNLKEATRWGERLPDLGNMLPVCWHVPARLLLAQGNKEAGARLLKELSDKLIRLGAPGMVIHIRIYQSLATDDEAQALDFLAEALTKAEPEGVIRWFVDEGELLRPLLEKALAQGITPAFTKKLLDIIQVEEKQRQDGGQTVAPAPPSGLLSEREIEVMRLVGEGLSNQQIADRLRISLSTAKTHVYHIFDKLDAKDRLQAVSLAKEMRVI